MSSPGIRKDSVHLLPLLGKGVVSASNAMVSVKARLPLAVDFGPGSPGIAGFSVTSTGTGSHGHLWISCMILSMVYFPEFPKCVWFNSYINPSFWMVLPFFASG